MSGWDALRSTRRRGRSPCAARAQPQRMNWTWPDVGRLSFQISPERSLLANGFSNCRQNELVSLADDGLSRTTKRKLTIMDGAMETTRVRGNCKIEVAWALPLNEIRAAMDMFEEKFAWAKNSRFSDRGREISVRFCRAR